MFIKPSSRSLTLTAMVAVTLLVSTVGLSQIPKECTFEPDWRPRDFSDVTVHVIRVGRTITLAIRNPYYKGPYLKDDENTYTVDSAACLGRGCSVWAPTAGADYPGGMYYESKYTPGCIKTSTGWHINSAHEELPENRTLSMSISRADFSYDISDNSKNNRNRNSKNNSPKPMIPGLAQAQQTTTEAPQSVVVAVDSSNVAALQAAMNVQAAMNAKNHASMVNEGGVYKVPVFINDTITLKFVVDSGAADVSIPADVVLTLIRAETITPSDFIGAQTYTLADGSTTSSRTFRIRSLKVGDIVLRDVLGSVADTNGELLLGQSFLGRFKSWSIDNTSHTLILEQGTK
jgi:clan AA aspartic protease (TIGR02281 family)